MPLKIVFAGTPEFAVPSLQALIDSSHQVVAVYTQPDRVAGRGRKLHQSPVKSLALAHHLPVEQPQTLRDPSAFATLQSYQADLMVVAAYGLLLSQKVLDLFRYGCVNVHASLLPRWRGAAPIQYSILAGDKETGVTLMQMVKALDAGDMLLKEETSISAEDNSQTLHDRLASMGASVLLKGLTQVEAGALNPIPQDDKCVTYAPKILKNDASVDWQQSACDIERLVRAFYGWPVAFTYCGDRVLRIWQARVVTDQIALSPGTLKVCGNRPLVGCGEGVLELLSVQLPGGKRITGADLTNALKVEEIELE